jgi:choice-of-anchor B domain-containing protein
MRAYCGICLFLLCLCGMANRLHAQANLNFRALLPYNHATNEEMSSLWGYSVAGHDYVIAGTTAGTSLVEITDPYNPVEILWVPGPYTYWREVKVWGTRAYIVNEESGGLQIINLASLPATAPTTANVSYWTGGTYQGNTITLSTAHTIWIDENGIGYLFGYNSNGGALMVNLAANPSNPPIVGRYVNYYIHDGFVRGDTLWAAHINDGFVSVVNVANKTAPITLATQTTSSNFSHNIWPTNNAQYAFTTDETSGSYIDAYDMSDLSNIQLVGQFRRTATGIQHNVHLVQDQFAVIAAYRDGVTVLDVSHPKRMIEVANYDTAPTLSGNGFNGCWGVYPYYASGKLVATDIEEGLYVFEPNYVGACFLEGIVTDATTGNLLQGASIQVSGNTAMSATSDFSGYYVTGNKTAGSYTITISKTGYITQTTTVSLTNNNTLTLNVALVSNVAAALTLSGQVADAATNSGIASASVLVVDANGNNYTATTNATGNYSLNLPDGSGTYSIYAGKWAYITQTLPNQSITATNNTANIALQQGYYDDFLFNFGWTVSTTASVGAWVRGEPYGTSSSGTAVNPEDDMSNDYGNQCYVTANPSDNSAGNGDVDNGSTVLTSPVFDLANYNDPHIKYSRWFMNGGGSTTADDQMLLKISNGTQTVTIETVSNGDPYESQWHDMDLRIADYITPTANMRFIADIGDLNNPHLVEGGIDGFSIEDHAPPSLRVQAKAWLMACYDISTSQMRNNLRSANLLPLTQPYNIAPFNYAGTEQVATAAQIPTNAIDWILLEVRNSAGNTLIESRAAWLLQDGTIADLDGTAGVAFSNLTAGNSYRLLLRHRNHLAVWAANSVVLPNTTPYDFRLATNIQGGTDQSFAVAVGQVGLIPADCNANGIISQADYNKMIQQNNSTNIYSVSDIDLDGNVNQNDFTYYRLMAKRIGEIIVRY